MMATTRPETPIQTDRPRPNKLRAALGLVLASRAATLGLLLVSFWLVIGLLSFIWTPYPPNASLFGQNLPPNRINLLGTDNLGRDTLSRLMVGTQVVLLKTRIPIGEETVSFPLGVAVWGVAGSLALGTLLGQIAGYRRGQWDRGIMQLLDAFVAFPSIVLYLVVIAALGRGDLIVILAIILAGAPGVARLARSLTLDISTRDYIRAAETRGESPWYIMFREILPNARGPLLVDGVLRVGYAIFAIGTLGFLGLGLPPPDPDWGSMVNEARRFMFTSPWGVIWPSLAIASLVIGLSLLADGLREELARYQR